MADTRRASLRRPGCPAGAEITPVEPDPGHAGEGRPMTRHDTPSWGIEPVPERLRVLGVARRVPALGEPVGLAARDRRGRVPRAPGRRSSGSRCRCPRRSARSSRPRSSATCCSALGGLIGADARVPTMVLLRAPLGRRGSYLPTGLNVLQCLGWSVFELIVIATGASALSRAGASASAASRSGRSSSASSRRRSRCSARSASCAATCASSRSGS